MKDLTCSILNGHSGRYTPEVVESFLELLFYQSLKLFCNPVDRSEKGYNNTQHTAGSSDTVLYHGAVTKH